MKILSDDFTIPKCPIELQTEGDVNYAYGYDDGQQSILSQLRDIDIDKLAEQWTKGERRNGIKIRKYYKSFSQFIRQQMEGKDESN